MTEIRNLPVRENALKLLAQSRFHLFLVQKNSVLGQTARFDIPIDEQDPVPRFGEFARAVNARRAGANDRD
jgi:hypothetical protein